jgi:hypothetical protein
MLPTLSVPLTAADQAAIQAHIADLQKQWTESLLPQQGEFGMRHLPRDPASGHFLNKFKTTEHTYTIIGGDVIGIEWYTYFQKRSVQMGFARNFQQIRNELQEIFISLGTEASKSNAIVRIKAMMDAVVDFGNEQFDASIWICTLFVMREDELISEYNEQIALEKIEDWKKHGYSEMDFFLLAGSAVPGYAELFSQQMQESPPAMRRWSDATDMRSAGESPKN